MATSKCNGRTDKNDHSSYEYEEACDKCGKIHFLETQENNNPEYLTDVQLKCECGNKILFRLPVN